MPKLSFLFPENEEFTGHWELLDIGISREYIAQAETRYFITEEQEMRQLIRPRRTFAHKGNFGHGLLIAGSYGMGGAAVLAARACMRSGIGLLTVHSPICNHQLLQTIVPKPWCRTTCMNVLCRTYRSGQLPAMAIGPGLSQEEITAQAALDQVSNCFIPLVLDADALNIFSAYRSYLNRLPKHSILTPHVKELERWSDAAATASNAFQKLRNWQGNCKYTSS